MSNTFLSKVVAERAALKLINKNYSGALQLTGLSRPAIELWRGKVALPVDHLLVQKLVETAALIQTLSNKSNETFTPLSASVQSALEQLMTQLTARVEASRGEA